jgi:hypothetical protein
MTKTWKAVYAFTKGKPIILLSATPSAQTYSQLYHQLKLSNWSPWVKLKSFYEWFRVYGIPETKFLAGRQIIVYDKVKPEAFEKTNAFEDLSLTCVILLPPVNVKVVAS